jgi:hypothetical protein
MPCNHKEHYDCKPKDGATLESLESAMDKLRQERKDDFDMSNFWKVQCLDCGINCDLLIDRYQRVICRECLGKNEFKEVDSVMEDFENEDSKTGMVELEIDS